MNYVPSVFRFFALPYGDDAQAASRGASVKSDRPQRPGRGALLRLRLSEGASGMRLDARHGHSRQKPDRQLLYYCRTSSYTTVAAPTVQLVSHDGAQLQRRESLLLARYINVPRAARRSAVSPRAPSLRTFTIPTYLPGGSYYPRRLHFPVTTGPLKGVSRSATTSLSAACESSWNAAPPAPSGLVAKSAGYTQVRLTSAPQTSPRRATRSSGAAFPGAKPC